MAACAAVVSERPVACIPCCGSVSPDVMVTGFMRWQHDWSTLRADAAAARSLTSLTAAAAGISEHAPAQAEAAADGSGAISSRSKPQVSEEEGDDENAGLQRPFNRAEATTRLLSIFQCEPFVSLCPFGPRVVLLW